MDNGDSPKKTKQSLIDQLNAEKIKPYLIDHPLLRNPVDFERMVSVSDQWRLRPMAVPSPPLHTGPNLVNIELRRNQSELFRAECLRLIQETDKACRRMKDDDNKRLDQRVRDIQFLKKELEMKLEEIIVEIDTLLALQIRVVKAQEACKEPLRVVLVCVEERMKRLPCDRVQDEVDKQLLKEKEVLEGVSAHLQHALEQITEQIRLNRSAKYQLEQDLKEKFKARSIDSSCALMTTHTLNSQRNTTAMTSVPSFSVTPKQWENISDVNITKAEQQKTNSVHLRSLVESVLKQTAADMQRQIEATTAVFQANVQEIKATKSEMEEQLTKIMSEFANQQRIRDDLNAAITKNQHFLSLAQARLDLRCQRPPKEQCHDPAQSSLITEVQQLTTQISKLHEALGQSEVEQSALARCQQELHENINVKASCLYTDEVVCTQHREAIIKHHIF